jgi:hypothetical protein
MLAADGTWLRQKRYTVRVFMEFTNRLRGELSLAEWHNGLSSIIAVFCSLEKGKF